ncbi:MAG TPA: methyltransferase domain-containing protein [Blastocatellia bacterium]|nr:methyltransferase domain-containing protein [Blastocatellia bacterium]HMV86564.1 methyltransferase domain-containing protein [Blastocatellia bacterium]HMX26898.1 methyltransferase domain-containing protein [Blastocatellia bacterium]HMY72530.1 methyltransferase domain-containing protein [Blastocatellia bacterium]HMZ16575.1 methyltransferase domain-containing protein [Blastocatellia bacterium]
MKRDWNQRAAENARWFINTLKVEQTEEEFDLSGKRDFNGLVYCELPLLTGRRDPKTLRVLEIGCGIGRLTKYLAETFGEVHGVDVSGEMIRQANERLANVPNAFFREGNGSNFSDFPDSYFDFVFSAYVFQHVPSFEVIRSNICDGFRVLKPRGIFKFVTSAVNNEEYLKAKKDTWSGHPFTEADIRALAVELGAQLMGVVGDGTQYCWTLLRKRSEEDAKELLAATPKVITAGRADNLANPDLSPRTGDIYLGLILDGIAHELASVSNLCVELGGRRLLPCYAGPVGIPAEHLMRVKELYPGYDQQTQMNVKIPADIPPGEVTLQVTLPNSETSEAITISLPPVTKPAPRIRTVTNYADKGLDIFASGSKSRIRILADQLDADTRTGDVRIQVNDFWIQPESVEYVAGNAFWEVTGQLPAGINPGEGTVRIEAKELLSASAVILIQ